VRRRYATFYAALLEPAGATLDGPGELDAETALTAELASPERGAASGSKGAPSKRSPNRCCACCWDAADREEIEYADRLLACNRASLRRRVR